MALSTDHQSTEHRNGRNGALEEQMTMNDTGEDHHGVLQSTFDVFVASTRAVADLATSAGAAGARAVLPSPVNESVARMLSSLRRMVEQAPQITDELNVLVQELHAKRLSIQALQSELSVLDQQLELLERSLAPVQAWSAQWNRMQHALLHSMDLPEKDPTPGS